MDATSPTRMIMAISKAVVFCLCLFRVVVMVAGFSICVGVFLFFVFEGVCAGLLYLRCAGFYILYQVGCL